MAKRIPIGRAILFFGGTVVLPAVAIFYHAFSEGWGAYVASILDPEALAADVPEAQRMQVYSASLMTIRVDTQAEAEYLDTLAKAMQLDEAVVNMLHMQMGLQPLYG